MFNWKVDPTDGTPIAAVGIEVSSDAGASGVVYLDYLTWKGTPELSLICPNPFQLVGSTSNINCTKLWGAPVNPQGTSVNALATLDHTSEGIDPSGMMQR